MQNEPFTNSPIHIKLHTKAITKNNLSGTVPPTGGFGHMSRLEYIREALASHMLANSSRSKCVWGSLK